jgi:hypothetical protein
MKGLYLSLCLTCEPGDLSGSVIPWLLVPLLMVNLSATQQWQHRDRGTTWLPLLRVLGVVLTPTCQETLSKTPALGRVHGEE